MGIITGELIRLDATLNDKESVIEYLVTTMKNQNRITDREKLLEDIYIREEEASTSMGLGIALPHAKSEAVTQTSVVFLRLDHTISWNTDNDIQLIFGIFVPIENTDNEHLKILAHLARKLMSQDFREQLLAAQTVEECQDLLQSLNKEKKDEEVINNERER
ncbi:PTS sugar transporter subunit IIA [Atopococcus tabaci]|uniref:PTS sugar transporter subunit IIA n=1 Tax=Atopococcus tabaci TaxID=269774 RepID=UPI00041AF10E|nr:fructose PTS transporter subunit IIA [Atopococcus tabaci]